MSPKRVLWKYSSILCFHSLHRSWCAHFNLVPIFTFNQVVCIFLVVLSIDSGLSSQSACNLDNRECSCADTSSRVSQTFFLNIRLLSKDCLTIDSDQTLPKHLTLTAQDCEDFLPSERFHVEGGIEECMEICQVRNTIKLHYYRVTPQICLKIHWKFEYMNRNRKSFRHWTLLASVIGWCISTAQQKGRDSTFRRILTARYKTSH